MKKIFALALIVGIMGVFAGGCTPAAETPPAEPAAKPATDE